MKLGQFGKPMRDQWMLDPEITYLNHGTVGAPPARILQVQQVLRDEIERQPSAFLLREVSPKGVGNWKRERSRLRDAANLVGEFLGAKGDDVVFVDNTTAGVNAVLRSFDFREGDELIVADLAYGGVVHAAEYATRVRGARVRTVELSKCIGDTGKMIQCFDEAIGPQTRLVLIDHITSGTALIMPV